MEVDVRARIAKDVMLTFNGAYTNAHLTQDNANLGAKAGDRLAGVPLYTATAALTWDYAPKSFVRVDYQQVGRAFNAYDPYGAPNVPAYGYASVALGKTIGAWQVSAHLKNIFDNYAIVSRHRSIFGQWDSTIAPRTAVLSARYNW
jgi:outer membrane receptor protein involved in Fe transport